MASDSGFDFRPELRAISAKLEMYLLAEIPDTEPSDSNTSLSINGEKKKIFIVHGHDEAAVQEMARTLEKSGFDAIILHEQPDPGNTIIEKIEKYSSVDYAVILYTECDLGRDKKVPAKEEKYRARQNVVFEHGYLMGKLGRDHVSALVKGDVEIPGDIDGLIYIKMDAEGAWKIKLAQNMKAANLPVDLNVFCL